MYRESRIYLTLHFVLVRPGPTLLRRPYDSLSSFWRASFSLWTATALPFQIVAVHFACTYITKATDMHASHHRDFAQEGGDGSLCDDAMMKRRT